MSIRKMIDPELGIPWDEACLAHAIACEMTLSVTPLGQSMAESRVALMIHNWDLREKDHGKWWDFDKREAMEDEYDPVYKRLLDAARASSARKR